MSQLLVPAPVLILALQAVREKRSGDWRDNGAVWISRVSASSEQPHRSQVTNGGIPLYSSSLSPRCVLHVFPGIFHQIHWQPILAKFEALSGAFQAQELLTGGIFGPAGQGGGRAANRTKDQPQPE